MKDKKNIERKCRKSGSYKEKELKRRREKCLRKDDVGKRKNEER